MYVIFFKEQTKLKHPIYNNYIINIRKKTTKYKIHNKCEFK